MKNEEIKKVKKVEIEVLDYFVDICKKNKLKYYMYYGTLIGVVRHHGFIPWDDDIDVCMPIDDYLKFLEIMKKEKNSDYYIQNIFNTEYFNNDFTKLRKSNTTYVEEYLNYIPIRKGINIDIFPMMKFPKNKLKQKIFIYRSRLANLLLNRDIKNDGIKGKIIYSLLHLLPKKCCNKIIIKKLNKLYSYKGEYDEYCIIYYLTLKKEWFKKSIDLDFEGKKYACPIGYDEALRCEFGDYMILPPENERCGHGNGKMILSFDKEYDEL